MSINAIRRRSMCRTQGRKEGKKKKKKEAFTLKDTICRTAERKLAVNCIYARIET